nr:sulfatase-like hydrolase/transferase [uncultured Allomuricauda sp.]
MKRKISYTKFEVYIVVLSILILGSCKPKTESKSTIYAVEKKPNIIFLLADDQTRNTINALGNSQVSTPNLDQLVADGTFFKNAYIMGAMNGAVCAPSRAMLMTGRALFNIDPTGNTIDTTHTTLPRTLGNAGYHTFHIGKWHNGKNAFVRSFDDGSKIFFGGMHRQYQVPTYEFDKGKDYSEERLNTPSDKHSSELYADAGVTFLDTYDSEKPFFMYLAFQAPHDPREMPKEYLDRYDPDSILVPENFKKAHPFDNGELDIRDEWLAGYPRTEEEIRANIAAYYAMITHLDAQIGRVLNKLEEKGLAENTIIVFAGDNGLAVGQHGLMGKQNLYEHSINVPLLFKGPGIPKGKTTDCFAYLFDIYPTLCDLTETSIPKTVEGQSLKPVLLDTVQQVRDGMFFAYKNFQRAVRNERYKLIKYNVDNKVVTQLFDLENDPFETTNLAEQPEFKKQFQMMTDLMAAQMTLNNDEADLKKEGWGVPVLPAWKDKVDKAGVEYLRGLAEEERQMRGFGLDKTP